MVQIYFSISKMSEHHKAEAEGSGRKELICVAQNQEKTHPRCDIQQSNGRTMSKIICNLNTGFTDSLPKEDAAGRRTFCSVSPNSHTSVTFDPRKSADLANLPCRLIVHNMQPERVNGIKFLGVIQDHKLNSHNPKKKLSKIKKCFSL